MKIYRDGKIIELTQKEMLDAYREVKESYIANDIGEWLWERVCDKANAGEISGKRYCEDWCYRVGREMAPDVNKALDNNDNWNEAYWIVVNDAIDEKVTELGFGELRR